MSQLETGPKDAVTLKARRKVPSPAHAVVQELTDVKPACSFPFDHQCDRDSQHQQGVPAVKHCKASGSRRRGWMARGKEQSLRGGGSIAPCPVPLPE